MKDQLSKQFPSRSFFYFLQLAETLNYTQSAQILGITQPALTQQIKKLEKSVDAELFYMLGKQLHLTEAGKTLQKAVEEVHEVLLEAKETIQKDKSDISGKITIGISASIEDKVFTDFIIHYYQLFPNIEITLFMVNRKEVWYSLEKGKIDLAILYVPEQLIKNWGSYETKCILKDELLFLHHNQEFCGKETISYEETLSKPWVTYPPSYFVAQVISNAFKKQQVKLPDSIAHLTKPNQMFKFSNETESYTALPRSFFQAHECEGMLEALPFNPAIDMELSFVFRKEKKNTPRIEHFFTNFERYLQDEDYISRLKNN